MRPTIEPCPSPTGRNAERLFLVKVPRGTSPELALDQALNRDKRQARDANADLHELRRKLDHFLGQCLQDEHFSAAMDILDQHLPSGFEEEEESSFGRVYGEKKTGEDETEHAEALAEKPIESSGMAGRDRRRAHDRKLAQDSGGDWLTELTARIGIA